MKKQLLAIALLCYTGSFAQTTALGTPTSWKAKVTASKKTVEMPTQDNATLVAAELNRRATTFEKNLRFGHEEMVSINFMQEAEVLQLPNGEVLRRLTIKSPNALSLNLVFSQFELTTGSRLYLFDKAHTEFIGAHTSLNNNVNRVLGTELIHSDNVVIELTELKAVAGQSVLVIGTVIHGFLDLENELKALNSSGDCEYDVNCPIGAGWENQRNATGMMVNGGGFCTGSLLNNTSGTIIPYFLSANHCGTNPAGWVFRFRWESPAAQADCATPANSVNGPEDKNVNGGVLRANFSASDFTLTELNTDPDPAWGIFYNGWNRTNISATSVVGVHHPAGDIMKISFDYDPVISTTFSGEENDSHWGVTGWDAGVTEGGSSGSPLFDENHRTIGQLHGGASACGGAQLTDEYGKIFRSWTGNGTNSSRLSNWLDPGNTGAETIDGVDPAGPGAVLDAGVASLQGVSGTYCSGTITPTFNITNNGSDVLTSATIEYGYDGSITQTYNWTGSLAQYQNELITLPSATLGGGAHTFSASVTNPNGSTDENAGNNAVSSSFTTVIGGETANLSITLDCYGSEISWILKDSVTNDVVYVGGPYSDDAGGTIVSQAFCVAAGCYTFTINDSFGDGLTSGGCAVPAGKYTILDADSDTLASILPAQANFGNTNSQTFCLGTGSSGINELSAAQNLWSVYPNPSSAFFNVNMAGIEGVKTIVLMNTTGQIVKEIQTNATEIPVEITRLAKGVYFMSLSSASGTTTKTVIVK